MHDRRALKVAILVVFLCVVTGASAGADGRWIEVVPAASGTPPTVTTSDVAGGVAVEVDLAGFFVQERSVAGTEYLRLTVPQCGGHGAVGEPHMPFSAVLVPVANGLAADLRVTESRAEIALTGVTVFPEQAPEPECGSSAPEFVIDGRVYSSDSWYPASTARIADDVVVRGQRFLVVEINPLAFNPARKELKALEHLKINIDLSGEIDAAAETRKLERRSAHFPTLVEESGTAVPDALPTGIEYLIIAADSLVTSVQPLADWKRKKGFTVDVVAMSTIGTTSAELKAFLQARYDADPDMTYVLLVGDHPEVPSENVGGMISDLYYSCLDGSDYLPDVVTGRIAVSDPTDCDNVVSKILAFDRDVVPGAWHGNYLMASYFESSSCQSTRWFFETSTHAMHYVRDVIGMGIHTAATSNNLSCNPYVWHVGDYPHRFSLRRFHSRLRTSLMVSTPVSASFSTAITVA